jgi:uncharacterized protein YdeI (BOF family)
MKTAAIMKLSISLLCASFLLASTIHIVSARQAGEGAAPPAALPQEVATCPSGIGFGETIQCSILAAGEVDTYTFSASAGDKVLVRISKSAGDFWPGIQVYAGGLKICENGSSTTAEIASCSLTSNGTYSIRVYDHWTGDYTGDYYLYLQRLNNPGTPTPIAFGQSLAGSILAPAQANTYTFAASAGDKVLVRATKSAGNFWPGVRIYDPGGLKICEDGGSTMAEIASCSLTSTGTYSILIFDNWIGNETGDYYLYLQRLNNPGTPTPITFGQTLAGSILTAAQANTYTFAASAGDKLLVRISKSAGDFWPGIQVYDPGGLKICENGSSTTAEIASCTVTSDGTYSILALDSWTGAYTGDYSLYLQRLNNPGSPTSITFGQTLAGSILTPAQAKTYTFTASAGDKVLVRATKSAGDFWPGVRVYDPGGLKICEDGGSTMAEIASCSLTNTGTYSILAFDNWIGNETGDYYLYLQRLNNPGSPTPIAFGQTLAGSILTPAQANTYTFAASAGDKLLVRISKSAGDFWPGMRVYDQSGLKICENGSSTTAEIASCTVTNDGTYSILALDSWTGAYTGDYSLYLQRLNNPGAPTSIAFGQTLAGSILAPAQAKTYTFAASAGDKLLVRLGKSAGDFWPGIRVYDPGGLKICEDGGSSMAEIASCSLASTGTYSILTFDNWIGNETGDYYLYLQRLNNPGSPIPIAFGQTLAGSILTPAQAKTYLYTTMESAEVPIRMTKLAGDLWPGIRVYNPEGTLICEGESSGTAEIPGCALPESGGYTILVFDSFIGTYTGDYKLTVGAPTFADVPSDHWAWQYIERLYKAGVTGGCSTNPLNYCPNAFVNRAQMAIFILRAKYGNTYAPPAASGTMFNDVPAGHWAGAWIEQLANEGITGGCGNDNYCPNTIVNRAQMAIFLLRGKYGNIYSPPAASGTMFGDVPTGYWAAAWIEQLANEGITGGCGGGNYCPNIPVNRAQMAIFLVTAFNLP